MLSPHRYCNATSGTMGSVFISSGVAVVMSVAGATVVTTPAAVAASRYTWTAVSSQDDDEISRGRYSIGRRKGVDIQWEGVGVG